MRRHWIVLLLAMTACVAKESAPASTDSSAAATALAELDSNCERWIANASTDSLVNGFFTSDAVFAANSPAATGREAIGKAFGELTRTGMVRIQLTKQLLRVADTLASEQGTYILQVLPKSPGDTTKPLLSDHGTYVTTFVKRSGEWRALYDIAVTSATPPAPPTPPASAKTTR